MNEVPLGTSFAKKVEAFVLINGMLRVDKKISLRI